MMTGRMRAAQRERYGTPETIRVREIAVPTPTADQILVRVRATTVSRTDCALLAARPFILRLMTGLVSPRQKTLGTDFAGVVEVVGRNVTQFKPGDRVFGINDMGLGSHAEYFVCSVNDGVARMAESQSFEEAAASVEGGWYAYSFLRRAGTVSLGTDVLINGATGGIGSALLQLCVAQQATVTAVGNRKNLEKLQALGAAAVIDYEHGGFTEQLRQGQPAEATSFDYVFDAVGKSTFGACKSLLKSHGIYSSSELGPGGQNLLLGLLTPLFGGRKVVFPLPVAKGEYLSFVRQLIEQGRFRPLIDRTVSLDELPAAYAYADSGQKTGNVVLSFS